MGVDNLLMFVKNATQPTNIDEAGLANSRAAVDISHWIYKACYCCPEVLYHKTQLQIAYTQITKYIDNYVRLLKSRNVQLTFVFDGMKLPAKQVTHKERSERKAESRRMVEKMLAENNASEARKYMLRCIDVKFDIVKQVIKYCKRENIAFIVAPYEADAQLALLASSDLCEFIITEDTDLILYGCPKIIYKLDYGTGKCLLYDKRFLGKCLGPRGSEVSFEKFRRICILSGCDYLKNIPGVGLQSAKKFFLMSHQDNLRLLLPKLSSHLKSPKLAGKVTEEYIEGFMKAETTFKHHIVYDPLKEKLRPLEPYPPGASSSNFPMAGKLFHKVQAKEIVLGQIDLDILDSEEYLDSPSEESELEDDEEEKNYCKRPAAVGVPA